MVASFNWINEAFQAAIEEAGGDSGAAPEERLD